MAQGGREENIVQLQVYSETEKKGNRGKKVTLWNYSLQR